MGDTVDLDEILEAFQNLKGKKAQEKLDAAINRKFTLTELSAAYREASEEERAEFRELFGGTPAQVVEEKPEEEKPKEKPKPRRLKEVKAEEKQMRPGRKTGSVYAWDVDDGGQVTKLDVARVYNGPDEDDEVEIPDAPEPEEDTEEEVA